jgi:hypothetical protein
LKGAIRGEFTRSVAINKKYCIFSFCAIGSSG